MVKSKSKKQITTKQSPMVVLGMGFILVGLTYVLVSLAIDTGSMPVYLLASVSIYMTIRTVVRLVKNFIRN